MICTIFFSLIYLYVIIEFISLITKGYCKSNAYLGGKTAVVTGGNSGIGYEVAANLASRGCKVIIADMADCQKSVERIVEETGNSNISSMFLDLGSFTSVREFAKVLLEKEERLDFLFNNAGCAGLLGKTEDGMPKIMQINYLGHFLLTHLLAPILIATKSSRIVFTSSLAAYIHAFKPGMSMNTMPDTQYEFLRSMRFYGNAKVCILAATNIFAKRFEKYGVVVSSCHPGVADSRFTLQGFENSQRTDLVRYIGYYIITALIKLFGKTPREGAQSVLHCALSAKVKSGDYICDCVNFPKPWVVTQEFSQQIWQESMRLAQISKSEEFI